MMSATIDVDFETYLAVKCRFCRDESDCTWYKIAMWPWNISLTASVANGRWFEACPEVAGGGRKLGTKPTCDDWIVQSRSKHLLPVQTFACEKLELPCEDETRCGQDGQTVRCITPHPVNDKGNWVPEPVYDIAEAMELGEWPVK